jgi:hypothetical protein
MSFLDVTIALPMKKPSKAAMAPYGSHFIKKTRIKPKTM